MTATQVQHQLLEEIESLSLAQRLLLLELIRSLRAVPAPGHPARELGPLRLHLSKGSPQSTWSREEIYGDDGR